MFVEVQLYLDLQAVQNYIEDPTLANSWNKRNIEKVVDIVFEWRAKAQKEFIYERVEKDLQKLVDQCHSLTKRRAGRKSFRRSFRLSKRPAVVVKSSMTNQELIQLIRNSSGTDKLYRIVLGVFLVIGLLPFLVNLCRIGAAGFQMFSYRKYYPKCLEYEVQNGKATVRHPEFFKFRCWRSVDYVLILGDFFGLLLHLFLVIFIIFALLFKTAFKKLFPSDSLDSLNNRSDEISEENQNPENTSPVRRPRKQNPILLSVHLYDEPPL